MSNTKVPEVENLPLTGRVNEVCQEWMVREDSALAYRLQNQEFSDHLMGNKQRNALVREDFPRAKDEQLREQQLAEQAAAIYHKMLAEQEELDNKIAKDLADKIEREERMKKRAVELRDQEIAKQLLDKERIRVEKLHQTSRELSFPHFSQQQPPNLRTRIENCLPPSPHRPNALNYQANTPRRQAPPMPLPQNGLSQIQTDLYVEPIGKKNNFDEITSGELYNEPYKPVQNLSDQFDRIDIAEVGLPIDEILERQIQEERDAKLARKLQEQEGSLEHHDRLLAIEAQDKELAKLLQERERVKAKRAREKAKQKALAKKQQKMEVHDRPTDQLMPDDSYAFPADILPTPVASVPRNVAAVPDLYAVPNPDEEDVSYSLPADVLPNSGSTKSNFSPNSKGNFSSNTTNTKNNFSPSKFESYNVEKEGNLSLERGVGVTTQAVRPTHLDLRAPLNRINKPRYPDPEPCESPTNSCTSTSPSHANIAIAIDPTYSRRGYRGSSSYDTASSTVTTSTSSSSPGMLLPPPDITEQDDDNPAPPYMPIQGQRRTSSLEKKSKKKNKDGGCKQQ